jgi:hypothetical protein
MRGLKRVFTIVCKIILVELWSLSLSLSLSLSYSPQFYTAAGFHVTKENLVIVVREFSNKREKKREKNLQEMSFARSRD